MGWSPARRKATVIIWLASVIQPSSSPLCIDQDLFTNLSVIIAL